MAWQMVVEPYPNNEPEVAFELFPEDRPRYQEAENQIRREINERYSAEGAIGEEPIYWIVENCYLDPASGWPWPVNNQPFRYRLSRPLPPSWDISYGITERAINLIEAVEPGVHRYLPIDCYNPDGSFAERRWELNCCSRLDTMAPEHSQDLFVWDRDGSRTYRSNVGNDLRIAVWRQKVQNRAIWVEYKWSGRKLLSDRLWEELQRKNIHGWTVHPRRHIIEV